MWFHYLTSWNISKGWEIIELVDIVGGVKMWVTWTNGTLTAACQRLHYGHVQCKFETTYNWKILLIHVDPWLCWITGSNTLLTRPCPQSSSQTFNKEARGIGREWRQRLGSCCSAIQQGSFMPLFSKAGNNLSHDIKFPAPVAMLCPHPGVYWQQSLFKHQNTIILSQLNRLSASF